MSAAEVLTHLRKTKHAVEALAELQAQIEADPQTEILVARWSEKLNKVRLDAMIAAMRLFAVFGALALNQTLPRLVQRTEQLIELGLCSTEALRKLAETLGATIEVYTVAASLRGEQDKAAEAAEKERPRE